MHARILNFFDMQHVSFILKGLNRPFPTLIKLNPAIPDSSIPELQDRIIIEESSAHDKIIKPGQINLIYICNTRTS